MSIFKKFDERRKLRIEKIEKAREGYVSWLEISNSKGWRVYSDAVSNKIEIIKKRMEEDSSLGGEELKRLQLALAVWREVERLPKQLEEKAKGGEK